MTRRPRPRGLATRSLTARLGRSAALCVVVGLLGVVWATWTYFGPGPTTADGKPIDVVVPSGRGLSGVAHALADAGAIRSPMVFMAAAAITGSAHRLKAGDYEFSSGEAMAKVMNAIRRGLVARRFVTIPEGLTSRQVGGILARSPDLTGPTPEVPEGVILPETYEVSRGETRAAVMSRMIAAREKLLDELWRHRVGGLPFATPEQAVVLASVVEKETGRADERPRIAAVFINRLRKGMRLESDPTVIYGVSGGEPLGHGLRVSELASRTPYNTYVINGLPPTPIANPGRAALSAALNPAPTYDLYFVADGSGGHVFADTFEAHKKNVARWRVIERSRNLGSGQ